VDWPAKLKAIRKREGITQGEMCELLDMSHSTLKKYEAGIIEMGLPPILKIANHPRFKKYTLWLLTDGVDSASEQISPQ
jgi:transcriptional regulator with XRE-family HTH domain